MNFVPAMLASEILAELGAQSGPQDTPETLVYPSASLKIDDTFAAKAVGVGATAVGPDAQGDVSRTNSTSSIETEPTAAPISKITRL
jgi:hypothetical protein